MTSPPSSKSCNDQSKGCLSIHSAEITGVQSSGHTINKDPLKFPFIECGVFQDPIITIHVHELVSIGHGRLKTLTLDFNIYAYVCILAIVITGSQKDLSCSVLKPHFLLNNSITKRRKRIICRYCRL